MKQIKCDNCGKLIYRILSEKVKIDNKYFEMCKQCAKLTKNFKINNSIK